VHEELTALRDRQAQCLPVALSDQTPEGAVMFNLRQALVAEAVRVHPSWVDSMTVVWCGVCPDEGTPASRTVNGYDVCDSGACTEQAHALVGGVSLLNA
jgi:hypothetical protein